MNNILKNWGVARIIRVVVGIGFGIYAIISRDYTFLWLTGILIFQAIFNISCCGASGCSSSNTKDTKDTKEVYKGIIKPYKAEKGWSK